MTYTIETTPDQDAALAWAAQQHPDADGNVLAPDAYLQYVVSRVLDSYLRQALEAKERDLAEQARACLAKGKTFTVTGTGLSVVGECR